MEENATERLNPTSETAESNYYAGYSRGYRDAILEVREHQQVMVKALNTKPATSHDPYPNAAGAYVAVLALCLAIYVFGGRE